MGAYIPSGAYIYIDSFGAWTDVGTGSSDSWRWYNEQNPHSISATGGRGGRAAAYFGDGSTNYNLAQSYGGDSTTRYVVHGAYRFDTATSGWPTSGVILAALRGNASYILTLETQGSGGLALYRNTSATARDLVASTGAGVLQGNNNYDFVEFRAYCASSPNGHYEVRVNGGTVLQGSGLNLSSWDTFEPDADVVQIGGRRLNAGDGQRMYHADHVTLIAANNTDAIFLGDNAVYPIFPTSDGNYTAWASTGGSHYSVVNETTDTNDDTAYISTATAGAKDSFGFGDVPASMTWAALQVTALGRQTSATPQRELKLFLRSGTTDSAATVNQANLLTTAYAAASYGNWHTNPFTSGNWTSAEINALEIGVTLTDSETTPTVRVTRLHAEAIPGPTAGGASRRWARSFG